MGGTPGGRRGPKRASRRDSGRERRCAAVAAVHPATGSFTTVGAQTVSLSLNAGANTIELDNPSAFAPDFNEILVAAAPSAS